MFDITDKQIEDLDDTSLRELIARLCEAELTSTGLSPLLVTWGGNQNAKDGGVDVRVNLPEAATLPTNLPRHNCVFQVKAADMPAAEILSEMQPGGVLRSSIIELAALSGAYIIVSSRGSVSDTPLKSRREAMANAVAPLGPGHTLHLDFYDRTRIAGWVRQHAGVILWTRERVGAAIPGWQSYGDWAGTHESEDATYLSDGRTRVLAPKQQEKLSAVEGIQQIRSRLSSPRGIVRLVGLSGTGKTRLAQALFDERIGVEPLSQGLAVYTNISHDPTPQPIALATELVAKETRAILIIDNCAPELHRELVKVCGSQSSLLSLLTIEYDVHEDLPEKTGVFELEPASGELVRLLLKRRFPHLSDVDIDTIQRASDGNARVAIALAETVEVGQSVATLKDADLFRRLFEQRQAPNPSVLQSAQAAALVYSFDGVDDSDSEQAEMWKLARTQGLQLQNFHQDLKELERRDLLQKRGPWRALLPHAIANHLAAMALENILSKDLKLFCDSASPRLYQSLSRRLGFLHESEPAQELVKAWLAQGGRLGTVEDLEDFEKVAFVNVAPVAPRDALAGIERALDRQTARKALLQGEEYRVLVRSIAYDPALFDAAFSVLIRLIESEPSGPYANQVRNDLASLFQIALSGSHATIDQRIVAAESLMTSSNTVRIQFGFEALKGMLRVPPFSSFQRFDFGGHPRDYGYQPKTFADTKTWYSKVLLLCRRMDALGGAMSFGVRDALGRVLRGIYVRFVLIDEIEELCAEFAGRQFWPAGLVAVGQIRRFRKEPISPEADARLKKIEEILEPRDLKDRVRLFVLNGVRIWFDDLGIHDHGERLERVAKINHELGARLAQDETLFLELLPEMTVAPSGNSFWSFAEGLVEGASDRRRVWHSIDGAYRKAAPARRHIQLLRSYLSSLSRVDMRLAEELLEETSRDEESKAWYPIVQSSIVVGDEGFKRLQRSIDQGDAPADHYSALGLSRDILTDDRLAVLVPRLGEKPGGFRILIEAIAMRVVVDNSNGKHSLSPSLAEAARQLLASHSFCREEQLEEYELQQVIKATMTGVEGERAATAILENLSIAELEHRLAYGVGTVMLRNLMTAQPKLTLDVLYGASKSSTHHGLDHLLDFDELRESPFDEAVDAYVLEWCEVEPDARFKWFAQAVTPFAVNHVNQHKAWKPLALEVIERTPDRVQIMALYINHLRPGGWIGSASANWEANNQLFNQFLNHPDQALATFVARQLKVLKKEVEDMRAREDAWERQSFERFE
jgi:hypothetical protein